MNKRELLVSAICHAYASMVVNETKEEYRTTIWYQQAYSVDKYFSRRKPMRMNPEHRLMLDRLFEEIKMLDADYFTNKNFSPYICMFYCIDYLINELSSTSIRVKFGHLDISKIRDEIETTDGLKGTGKDTYGYFTEVLNIVERI